MAIRDGSRTPYMEKLRDPRWQKKRLEILERDKWRCILCLNDKLTLAVHHRYYERGREPWEYPPDALATLCEACHETETDERPAADRLIVDASHRGGLMAGDVDDLATSLVYLGVESRLEVELSISALSAALRNRSLRALIIREYLCWLVEQREQRGEEREAASDGAQ